MGVRVCVCVRMCVCVSLALNVDLLGHHQRKGPRILGIHKGKKNSMYKSNDTVVIENNK